MTVSEARQHEINRARRFTKQNLKVKAFLGNSYNAVMTQLFVALIACLLLCCLKLLGRLGVGLQRLLLVLQLNLFTGRTLRELSKPPGERINKQCILKRLTLKFI